MKFDFGKLGLFAGGVLFGTAGLKILSSREARKVYTYSTAAALRAKEEIMTKVTTIKENAEDIFADAKCAEKKEVIEDSSCGCCEAAEAETEE